MSVQPAPFSASARQRRSVQPPGASPGQRAEAEAASDPIRGQGSTGVHPSPSPLPAGAARPRRSSPAAEETRASTLPSRPPQLAWLPPSFLWPLHRRSSPSLGAAIKALGRRCPSPAVAAKSPTIPCCGDLVLICSHSDGSKDSGSPAGPLSRWNFG
jgi:hypothetical protein